MTRYHGPTGLKPKHECGAWCRDDVHVDIGYLSDWMLAADVARLGGEFYASHGGELIAFEPAGEALPCPRGTCKAWLITFRRPAWMEAAAPPADAHRAPAPAAGAEGGG